MNSNTPAAALLRGYLNPSLAFSKVTPVLDSVSGGKGCDDKGKDGDEETIMDSASEYTMTNLSLNVASALQQWAESDDMADGETVADRLFALLGGIVDFNEDGEISDDEQEMFVSVCETAWDYLSAKGVPDNDIDALLNNFDNGVATRVQELLADRLPDGDEAAADDINSFAFGDGSDESALDAVYKMKIAIKGGKKMRIKKRISGTIRHSAAQKVAIRKMLRKSHNAQANMKRMKSMKIRRRSGL